MTCTAINMPETVSVALLVIAGQFGNGEDRKMKLEKKKLDTTMHRCKNV